MPDALRDPAAERAASIREAVKKYEDQGLDVPKHLSDLAKGLPKVKTVAVETKPDDKDAKAEPKVEPKPEPPKATDPKPATTSDPEPETKVADKPVAKVETVEPTGPKPAGTDAAAAAKPVPPPGPASSRVQRK